MSTILCPNSVTETDIASAVYAGVYAAELAKHKSDWDIKAAVTKANRATAISSATIGYQDAVPWLNQLTEFDLEALYDTIDDLKKRPKTKSLPWEAKVPRHQS